MQFSILWVAAAIVIGYVFGTGITVGIDRIVLKSYRRRAKFAEHCLTMLVMSCRNVLSDGWYNKVIREYKSLVERSAM